MTLQILQKIKQLETCEFWLQYCKAVTLSSLPNRKINHTVQTIGGSLGLW